MFIVCCTVFGCDFVYKYLISYRTKLQLDALALKNILSVADNSPPLKLYWKDGVRGWNVAQKSSSSVELQCGTGSAIAGLIKQYMEEGRQQKLVDFEYHLEDLSADWLNPSLLV